MHSRHFGAEQGVNVRPRRELVDEITRSALLVPVAAAQDRHGACVGGEEERRLPCRVARTDDVNVLAVCVGRFAARRAVRDALPGKAVETGDRQVPPGDPAGEDERPRAENVSAVQMRVAPFNTQRADLASEVSLGREPVQPGGVTAARPCPSCDRGCYGWLGAVEAPNP